MRHIAEAIGRLLHPPGLVLVIRDGRIAIQQGKPRPGLLDDFAEVAENLGIRKGKLYACAGRLSFSHNIPETAHQRFRNVWHTYNI